MSAKIGACGRLAAWVMVGMAAATALGQGRMKAPVAFDAGIEQKAGEPYQAGEAKAAGGQTQAGRTKVRQLYSFEEGQDGQPIGELMKRAEGADFIYVQDNGVSDGKWCARMTVPAGADFGMFYIEGAPARNWGDFDYAAMDVYTNEVEPLTIQFELWDQKSTNYATRCTLSGETRAGRQTLLFQINRAKRNSKEGRGWEELAPDEKIDLNNLKYVKVFTAGRKDRPIQLWIDNIRLMQEDAAKPKMHLSLPASAIAFDFASAGTVVPGFKGVTVKSKYADEAGYGFVSTDGLAETATGWPDLLSGAFIRAAANQTMEFKAKVPNGKYLVWLCAGPVLEGNYQSQEFLLKLNDKTLYQDKPSFKEYDSEKYLYRFMWTQYSERPHALWLDYIDVMYPVRQETMEVTDGQVTLTAKNYFLGALILVPAGQEADFQRMAAKIQTARMEAFEKTLHPSEQPAAEARGGMIVYTPGLDDNVGPGSSPGKARWEGLRAAGAPGQNIILRLAVRPFQDVGAVKLTLSDLKGPGGTVIPPTAIQGFYENYRYGGRGTGEMALMPTLAFNGERSITHNLWLWLTVPQDAKAGKYSGEFALTTGSDLSDKVPVEIEVYPIKLATSLPVSYGMYYSGRNLPQPPKEMYWEVIEQQFRWMRKIGFTASSLMAGANVTGIDEKTGQVSLQFQQPTAAQVAKQAGLAQSPSQQMMTGQLGVARSLGRQLFPARGPGGSPIESNPGVEFTSPRFKGLYLNAMKQYKQYLDALQIPYAIEIVDEPREVPNPWNRNLEHTNTYGDWMKEVGLINRFVTPMGDGSGGKDYSSLVDHADILSVHAWPGSKGLMEKTRQQNKTLWFYNSGMSRVMWGFYPWKHNCLGRWEWHWCDTGQHDNGYPGNDWYNPFTGSDGMAVNAPISQYPGGFLPKSAFFTAAEGITDYAYLYSLKQAMEQAQSAGGKGEAVKKAQEFFARTMSQVPQFPGPELDKVSEQLGVWRAEVAGLLQALQSAK